MSGRRIGFFYAPAKNAVFGNYVAQDVQFENFGRAVGVVPRVSAIKDACYRWRELGFITENFARMLPPDSGGVRWR